MSVQMTNGSGETVVSQPPRATRKIDKVVRYQWLEKNQPPELSFVSKHLLRIDRRYQRALNDKKRLAIASNFNWAAFGVLIVARRPDGTLWCMDGQHRLGAAMDRDDIDKVPVAIFDLKGNIAEEAQDFLAINTIRRPLNGPEKFSAKLTAEDAIAIQVNELVRASGRSIGARGGAGVMCVTAFTRAMSTDAPTMRAIWPIVVELSAGEQVHEKMLTALFALERRLVDSSGQKRSLTEAEHRRKLIEAGYSKVLRAIGDAAAYYSRGGDVVWARGVLNILNYKKQNRLLLKGDSEA